MSIESGSTERRPARAGGSRLFGPGARHVTRTLASARSPLIWVAIVTVLAIWALRDLALLVGCAVLLAYALLPVVRAIERVHDRKGRHLPRVFVAACVMLTLVAGAAWLVALAVPRVAVEATRFASEAPLFADRIVGNVHGYALAHGFGAWLDPAVQSLRGDVSGLFEDVGGTLARGAAGLFGGIGNVMGLALLPLLAFYLLAESGAVLASVLRFVPEEGHAELARVGHGIDRALRSYVRGQAIVCVVMGTTAGTALALLHHPFALLLGLLAGAAECIPYIGFMVAAIAIALAGWNVSAFQVLAGLTVYIALNWAMGTFVTPRLMGRYLRMHAFVVTVSVLAGARLLGPVGALLALPVVAALQAAVGELAPATHRALDRSESPGA